MNPLDEEQKEKVRGLLNCATQMGQFAGNEIAQALYLFPVEKLQELMEKTKQLEKELGL